MKTKGREKMKLKYDDIEIELTGKSIGLEQFAFWLIEREGRFLDGGNNNELQNSMD